MRRLTNSFFNIFYFKFLILIKVVKILKERVALIPKKFLTKIREISIKLK